jgi:actin-like ATPase involved in cell morphogenesis
MTDKIEKKEIKFKPGVGIDIGTSFIVTVRQTEDGTFVNKFHRNCLFAMDINDESADLLERSNYFFIKTNDKYYVCGEDAISLVNAIGKGNIIRPMKDGILNPNLKESSDLLFHIIKSVLGEPIIKQENLRFTIPANTIDGEKDNLFHKMVLQGLFTKMGYDAKPINEAMCVIYDNNPVSKNDDGELPLTGIASSHGAGQTNVCLSFKGMSLAEFSCTKSGDNIDEQVEKVTGISKSKIVKIKEKKLDLGNIDPNDKVQTALSIFYDETINRVIHNISEQFRDKSSEVEGELEWVVAGGTSMPPNFCKKLEEAIKKSSLPFKIYRVRHAAQPFTSVGQGACIRALADYQKTLKK